MQIHRIVICLAGLAPVCHAQPAAISGELEKTAEIIGIGGLLRELGTAGPADTTEARLQRLELRQEMGEAIVAADLDVDATVASIQREQSQIQAVEDRLSAQRDRSVNVATLAAAIAGSGIGIIGAAMQFSSRTAYAGDGVSVASGAAATALAVVSVKLQRGGKGRIGIAPNMLARIFERPAEAQSTYPEDVWEYLNTAPGGAGGETRIERLKAEWTKQGRLAAGAAAARKIELVTASFPEGRRVSLSGLSDRFAMLSEVRAQTALMKRDLAQLLRRLRQQEEGK